MSITPLTGFTAWQKFLEIAFPNSSEIWLKAGHNSFYTGNVSSNGTFPISTTSGGGTDRKKGYLLKDAFDAIAETARTKDGGAFFIPGKPQGFPLKDYCHQSELISAEMDNGGTEEQWERVKWFSHASGLQPALVIGSGGKSIHVHFKLSQLVDIATRTHLCRLLSILLISDPAVCNPHQPMRIPGFHRKEKGREQTLETWSYSAYSLEQVLQGFSRTFDALNAPLHTHFSNERWHRLRAVLVAKDETAKRDRLSFVLRLTEDEINPPKPVKSYSGNYQIGEGSLVDIVENQIKPRLRADDIFGDLQGWKRPGKNCWCPFCTTKEPAPSFSVNDKKQVFHCFACETSGTWVSYIKQLYNLKFVSAVKYLGDLVGVTLPEWKRDYVTTDSSSDQEISDDEYAAYIQWQSEQDQAFEYIDTERTNLENAENWKNFAQWWKQKFYKLGKFARKGFGINVVKTPKKLPKLIKYSPDAPLPTPDDYQEQPLPKIEFGKGDRLKVVTASINLGYKGIVDTSFMGAGKSHDLGKLEPDPDGSNKIWYFDQNHRNVSTPTVRNNFEDLNPRHDGLFIDKSGNLKPAKTEEEKEQAITLSNCYQADIFLALKNKNYAVESATPGELNPICRKCPMAFKCGKESGDGYGFRFQRKNTMENRKIRASIDSAPSPNDYDFSQDIAIVEESGQALRGTRDVTAKWSDLLTQFDDLEAKLPEIYAVFSPFKIAIRKLLNGEIKQELYGLDDAAIREHLPAKPDNLAELIQQIEDTLHPKITSCLVEPDSVVGVGGAFREAANFARSHLKKEARRETLDNLKNLPVNSLIDLLSLWGNLSKGAIRINHDTLKLTLPDTRHRELLSKFKALVYLDATNDDVHLANLTGDRCIIQIEEEKPDLSNLTIYNTHIEGLGSGSRSDAAKDRIAAFKQYYRTQVDAHTKFIGMKGETDIDGYWHHHSRGSNAFAGVRKLVSFGTPYPNIGQVQDEYLTIYGTLDGFDEHYQHLIESEIIQCVIGRQRVHRYPDQQFTYDFVGTGVDLSFLERYGVKVVNSHAVEVCPEAGTATQLIKYQITKGTEALLRKGRKLTQANLEEATGVAQDRISKVFTQDFTWQGFKELCNSLFSSSIGNCIIFETDKDWRKWLDLDPLEVATELLTIAVNYGWESLQEYLETCIGSSHLHFEILGLISELIPDLQIPDDELSRRVTLS